MARVTIELRHLLELDDFELFDFDYEFDDKKFARELEQAVIDYYYFSEIGQPTPDKFKHVFKSRWLSMIGYYNQLHNTTLLKYNPLINYKISEALEKLSQASSNATSSSNEDVKSSTTDHTEQNTSNKTDEKFSDYPQQPISGGDYLSGARQSDSTTDTSSNTTTSGSATTTREDTQRTTTNSNENYEKTIEGLTGMSYQELIRKERENLIRIKQMVIEELKPCFLLVYN